MQPRHDRYVESLNNEIKAQESRVRDLIGDRHWYSDGHHKELLLKSVLERHLPAGIRVSRGFIVSSHLPDECSAEQDLIIFDSYLEAPLFDQGGVVVVFPRSVVATVSVKSSLTSEELHDVLVGANTVRLVASADNIPSASLLLGGYFFEQKLKKDAAIRRTIAAFNQLLESPAPQPKASKQRSWPGKPLRATDDLVSPQNSLDMFVVSDTSLLCTISGETIDNDEVHPSTTSIQRGASAAATLVASIANAVSRRRGQPHMALETYLDNSKRQS